MKLRIASAFSILGLAATAYAQPYSIATFAGVGTWTGDGHPVLQSVLTYPQGLAAGADGSIYMLDGGHVRRVTPDGIIHTVAGNLASDTDSGDGGPATSAIISAGSILAVDSSGNIFVGENPISGAGIIRKVQASDGTIQHFAGNGQVAGTAGSNPGDGGPAVNAPLGYISGMATTPQGNLIVANANQIVNITPDGTISTLAGGGTVHPKPANISTQPALGANLNSIGGVATDPSGNIFFTEADGEAVFQLSGTEIVHIAGSGNALVNSAAAPLLFNLNFPIQLAADSQGNLYILDGADVFGQGLRNGMGLYSRIVKLAAGFSSISTIAGANSGDFDQSGDLAIQDVLPSLLAFLAGLTADSKGIVYYSDANPRRLLVQSIVNGVIQTFAGGYRVPYSGDGGPATSAQFYYPYAIIFDPQGNAYIADAGHNLVLKVNANGVISTFAGIGSFGFSGDGGSATAAQLGTPSALAFDAAGNLYIADSANQRIREVTIKDGNIQTVIGSGQLGGAVASVPADQAAIDLVSSMLFDPAGNLIFADSYQCSVRKWNPSTNVVTLIAGAESCGTALDGTLASGSPAGSISGIALASDGTLYFADSTRGSIRTVNNAGLLGTFVLLSSPAGLVQDSSGNFYTGSGSYVEMITPGKSVQIIAGSGPFGYDGDGKPALQAALQNPKSPIVDASGNIFFIDGDRIRELIPPPQVQSVVNAASFVNGPVAPGEMVTVFGTNIGPRSFTGLELASNGTVSNNLAATQALFDGIAAPMVYADQLQTSFLVPFEVAGKTNTQFTMVLNGVASNAKTLEVAPAAPGIFTAAGGKGQGAILNQDGSANSASNPAAKGSVVVLYATGAGQTNPSGQDGVLADGTAPKPVLPVTFQIGGMPARLQYAGGASGLVAGVMQVNAVVPKGIVSGSAVPVTIKVGGVGGVASQSGVTLAVK
jgi:uncharacterized protein (TIGR03437 family)